MIINTKEVQKLIDSDFSATQIGKEMGLSIKNITRYRSGEYALENMTLKYLSGLQRFYNDHKDDPKPIKIKIKGIRKAVTDFNGSNKKAWVYLDPQQVSVWTADEQNRDKDIVEIAGKTAKQKRITMLEIKNLTLEVLKDEKA